MPWCNGISTGYVHMCWGFCRGGRALQRARKYWDAGDLVMNMGMIEILEIDNYATHILTCFS